MILLAQSIIAGHMIVTVEFKKSSLKVIARTGAQTNTGFRRPSPRAAACGIIGKKPTPRKDTCNAPSTKIHLDLTLPCQMKQLLPKLKLLTQVVILITPSALGPWRSERWRAPSNSALL